jgi:hypothetical protein
LQPGVSPFQLFFPPPELTEELKKLGFRRTETGQAEEINAHYFTARTNGLGIGGDGASSCAWV